MHVCTEVGIEICNVLQIRRLNLILQCLHNSELWSVLEVLSVEGGGAFSGSTVRS